MGVPGLWPFIKELYLHTIKRFLSGYGAKVTYFDYVYLDANPLLHAAAQMIENYGDKKRALNPYTHLTAGERRLKIFEKFFDNIVDIVTMIRPKKVLYIAIDGPAPRAKQNQQRERRFIAAQLRKIEEDLSGTDKFDSTSISPGTEFMHELSKYMYWKIRWYMQHHVDWQNVEVIYSPPTVPGEGEHKVMGFIRSLPQYEKDNATHCMFGPDGDLMMLTLSAHVKHIHLFREDQFEPGYVDLVNISMIRRGLCNELNQHSEVKRGLRTEHDVSNDFVFIGFFVGNDFLPKIKMFYRLADGLKKMFEIYSETEIQCQTLNEECYLTTKGRLNIEALRRFVGRLSDFEEDYLAKQAIVTSPDPRFVDHTLLEHSTVSYTGDESIITQIDMVAYRPAYYKHAGVDITDVNKMCESYLHNLVWVYKYYTDALPSWGDAYEYHYAPLMMDFSKYINNLSQDDVDRISSFDIQRPALPFEQLLSILSPNSAKLLPKDYSELMTNPESPLVKAGYYPLTFDIDYEGKTKEFQGVAKLPFVDFEKVAKAYKEVTKETKYKYHRNTFGKACNFKYKNSGYLADFTSRYGTIIDCRVKTSIGQYVVPKRIENLKGDIIPKECDIKLLVKTSEPNKKIFHNIFHLQKELKLTTDDILILHHDCLVDIYNKLHDDLDFNMKKLAIATNNPDIDPFIGKGTLRDQVIYPFDEENAENYLLIVLRLTNIMWKIDDMTKSYIVPTVQLTKNITCEYVVYDKISDATLSKIENIHKCVTKYVQ